MTDRPGFEMIATGFGRRFFGGASPLARARAQNRARRSTPPLIAGAQPGATFNHGLQPD